MTNSVSLRNDFLWGAATSAHQVEGSNTTCDWWPMEQSARGGHIQEPSGDACDSYHRYRDDIRLLAEAGLTAYRFSIEWARIEPVAGQFSRAQMLHYRDMIDACHEHGVEPIVTLHHFTNPIWLADRGGLRSPDIVERFAGYVEAIAPILHDVNWVVTINEPNMDAVFVAMSDLMQRDTDATPVQQAPGATETPTVAMSAMPWPSYEVAEILVRMHKAAVAVLRERTRAKVGWAIATQAFTPTPGNEDVFERAFQQWEGVYFDAATGDDFVGVQSYTSQPVNADGPVPHPQRPDNTLTGWAYRPDALGINLKRIWMRYGIPILVTENGIATTDDTRRIAYTRGALEGLKEAVAEGADVRGYCHWSLLDNYEWGSYRPTFGLIAVDRTGDFTRTPKPSLAWLGAVAAQNGADLT